MCIDIPVTLENLFKNRAVFHSEDDFKFSLAWQIKIDYEDVEIRLERVYNDMHIDILVMYKELIIGIELKYSTKKVAIDHNKEKFTLAEHGAQGQRRFEFYKDINRLEVLKNEKLITAGHVILLTNDISYRNAPRANSKTNRVFNIADNHNITEGLYRWSADKDKSREGKEIKISGTYQCNWSKLNHIDARFQYLHLEI